MTHITKLKKHPSESFEYDLSCFIWKSDPVSECWDSLDTADHLAPSMTNWKQACRPDSCCIAHRLYVPGYKALVLNRISFLTKEPWHLGTLFLFKNI